MTASKNAQAFLKAIQIQGFKSFADKIRIDLQPGLSVIVGPNGSGKSNVADAVRWVLGEQSAKSLRGSKMEDVIFAGSSARRPVGMAEVSLIFDNATGLFALDYEEVVITRRVYRDGEGHYFINRTPCRLKDIQELFLDTGSGKEGFSIIGQGRVEEILNLKSEERRILIEEVAGISKFRLRKKEALKKLDETEQNVNRLSDIISEVEGRLEPLAKQAEVAAVSKELTTKLDKAEINLIVNELFDINKKLKKSQETMAELNTEVTLLTTRIAEEENLNIRGKYELNQLEESVQNFQGEVYSLENKIKEVTHESSLMFERQGHTEENAGRLEREINDAEEKLSQSRDKLAKMDEKRANLQKTLQEASKSLQQLENSLEELRNLGGGVRLDNLKTEIFEELATKSKLSNEIAEIEYKKSALLKQEDQFLQEIKTKEEQRSSIQKDIQIKDQERLKIENKEIALQEKMGSVKNEIDKQKDQKLKLEEKNSVLIRKIDQTGARLNVLQTLEETLDGYHKGVKETIFACRKGEIKCSRIYGTVAENIEVQEKFEIAVETALGNSLQNIIVETTDDGKLCIAYLKKTNKGRATFLPLDAIKGDRLSLEQKTIDHKGFQGLAVDLVSYDKRFNGVMGSLLGRIIIADNMDSAIELARNNNYRFRVVTLQGDQVNIGGSLTGGSTRNQNSGILSRAREIEEISQMITGFNVEHEELKKEIVFTTSRIKELTCNRDDLESELKSLNEAKGIMAVERKHLSERIERLADSLRASNYELTDVRGELKDLIPKEKEIDCLIQLSIQKVSELQLEQEGLEKLVRENHVQAQELTEQITIEKVETARWEQELNQTRQIISEENEQIRSTLHLIEGKKTEMTSLQGLIGELLKSQDDFEKTIQSVTQELNDKKFRLVELRKKREALSLETIQHEEYIQSIRRQAKDKELQLHQDEIRVTRWQAEWDSGYSRLGEEYNLTWENALSYLTEERKELLQEKIQSLRMRIEELGPVNYTALDEYPEACKRFDFLTSQRNDLVEASNSLLELIGELDKNMIERFEEGFRAVNEAFQAVFKQLFNGGHAELLLDDPANLLETGVKIVAQPPGKKAQLLSLLSGGERSFTAIALLFAFLKVKPSPFCLLDEIEAALDEANVKRFVQYLHTLSDQTQFIVISHRRGTMESADRLYGITMEESGVSKLLTVELEDQVG